MTLLRYKNNNKSCQPFINIFFSIDKWLWVYDYYVLQEILEEIFGVELMKQFKQKRPAGFIDLMLAFESRKRGRILDLAIL